MTPTSTTPTHAMALDGPFGPFASLIRLDQTPVVIARAVLPDSGEPHNGRSSFAR